MAGCITRDILAAGCSCDPTRTEGASYSFSCWLRAVRRGCPYGQVWPSSGSIGHAGSDPIAKHYCGGTRVGLPANPSHVSNVRANWRRQDLLCAV